MKEFELFQKLDTQELIVRDKCDSSGSFLLAHKARNCMHFINAKNDSTIAIIILQTETIVGDVQLRGADWNKFTHSDLYPRKTSRLNREKTISDRHRE
jgi:hypothetical protein